MNNIPPVSIALTAKGIPHRVFVHAGPIQSLEQAAAKRDQRPEQIVRSILFRVSKGEYVMVLMAGPQQIDWKTLRQYLGTNRVTMAKREEVLAVTGYELGAVAPFGMPQPIRVLVDQSLQAESEVSLGSGTRGAAIILQTADLMNALGDVEIGRFCGEDCE